MTDSLLRTGQFFVFIGLFIACYALGVNQSQREIIQYRYLPRQLDDIEDIDAAGLQALQRALA
jgi:hypothetical protein